ncbi:unnamed protein product [Symbiodinium necroappetens]|uniref:J domain-containing protein n=1 Tax=Symbiodinium necroappetens TaxID=1628268 RepID=A0A813CKZ5_9DINO|nr:unnamed protein product [Symbiodinium necroappetens]
MDSSDAGRSHRLKSLLSEFGLPPEAEVPQLQARYRFLAKQRHPDMVSFHCRRHATADFVKLHSRYRETLSLLQSGTLPSGGGYGDHIIRSHNGLFYHDPYKWAPSKRGGRRWQREGHYEPPASWMTKIRGLAVVGCLMALVLFVFDRTARKRSLTSWN